MQSEEGRMVSPIQSQDQLHSRFNFRESNSTIIINGSSPHQYEFFGIVAVFIEQICQPKTLANGLQSVPAYLNRNSLATFFTFQNWGLRMGV